MMDSGYISAVASEGGRAELDCFRVLYCVWIAGAVLVQLRRHAQFVARDGSGREVPRMLDWLTLPRLHEGGFVATGLGLVACLAFAIVWEGDPALPLLAAAVGSFIYFAQVVGVPEVRRKANTVPIILLLLGAAYLARSEEVMTTCRWALKLVVAQVYFASGVLKLKSSGLRWADGVTLRTWLVRYHLQYGGGASLWVARRTWASRFAAGTVLAFELTFWLVIPFPDLAWIYLPAGIGFHVGTAVLMRINYWIYIMPAYLVFIRF